MMHAALPCCWLTAVLFLLQPFVSVAADVSTSDGVIAIYPLTTGASYSSDRPISKVIVLSPQIGPSTNAALAAAKDVFQRGGMALIEHTPSPRTGERQGPDLRERSTSDAGFLAIGKRAGADHVMVVEVTDTLVLADRAREGTAYLHDERVSVRGLSVNTGMVVLEGTARWSHPIERAGDHIRELTTYAIARAICAPEKWVEASAANHGRGRCRR